jgi:integrase
MLNLRRREMGLGSLLGISIAEARGKAATCRRLVANGLDPIEVRENERAQRAAEAARNTTFAQCAKRFIEAHEGGWRNEKHAGQWRSTLKTYCDPVFGSTPVQQVDTALVLKVLEPIWTIKPETATRVRSRIERILDWARVRDHRSGENPARWRGHLDKLLPTLGKKRRVKHYPALPFRDVGRFMATLRKQEGFAARALELLILTASRTTEVISAKWTEFDLAHAVWTIPAERMKAHQEHRVPLSVPALKLLRSLPHIHGEEFLFPGVPGKHLSNMALLELLRRMGRDDITVHGFRSTFRDWAAECTNFSREVCEMALAHTVNDAVEAAYRRGDLFHKRRRLMSEWASFCAKHRSLRRTRSRELPCVSPQA